VPGTELDGLPAEALCVGAFVFGALWGSFFNVCIVRLPLGRSIVRPASHCPSCHAPIRFYDNIPILSYLWLRGRCRACGVRISPRYLLVELLAAVLCLALFHRFGFSFGFFAHFVLAGALLILTFIDLEHFVLPNEITYALVPAGLGLSFLEGATVRPLDALLGAAAGAAALLLVAGGYQLLRGVRGLGLGDVKLLAGIGAFVGWRALPLLLFLAAAQGLLVAGLLLVLGKREQLVHPRLPDEEGEGEPGPPPGRLVVPFGPFLALATLEVVFFGEAITRAVFGWSG
jgi:leader peptidase (prepilin peptidase)/N-methyltransferase